MLLDIQSTMSIIKESSTGQLWFKLSSRTSASSDALEVQTHYRGLDGP